MATPSELIEGYTRDLRFDPRRLFNENNELLPIPDLPEDIALSLVSFNLTEDLIGDDSQEVLRRKINYKFPNKNQVRDSMAKLLGLTNGNADVIKAIMEAVGLIAVNVQNNNYNIQVTDALRRAIEQRGKV
jgi:hypothetical protein